MYETYLETDKGLRIRIPAIDIFNDNFILLYLAPNGECKIAAFGLGQEIPIHLLITINPFAHL